MLTTSACYHKKINYTIGAYYFKKLIENIILSSTFIHTAVYEKEGRFYAGRTPYKTLLFSILVFCFNFKCEITETINLEAEIMI